MNYLWAIYIPLSVYLLHWFLTEKTELGNKHPFFKEKYFRLFWNVLLLLTFLASGISGVMQILVPSYTVTVVHRYSGLVLVVLASAHILKRLYFFQGFIREFSEKRRKK